MNKNLKLKSIVFSLLLSLGMSQTTYASSVKNTNKASANSSINSPQSARNFEEYKQILYTNLANYRDVITINYFGNETFLEDELTEKLRILFNQSLQNLSAFDKQNLYSIKISGSAKGTPQGYALRIAQYELQYKNSAEELKEVDLILSEILEEIRLTSKNEYEMIQAAYNYVLSAYRYEKLAADDTDTKNLLLERNLLMGLKGENGVVCDAYSMLLCRLLTSLEIENLIVVGTAYDELHAWNMVKLEGNWYHIDPTWGDSTYAENKEKYFLTSDQILRNNGRVWDETEYPAAPTVYLKN